MPSPTVKGVLDRAGIESTVALVRFIKTSPLTSDPSPIAVASAAWAVPASELFVPDKGLLLADWLVSTLVPRAQTSSAHKSKKEGQVKPKKGQEDGDSFDEDRLSYWALLTTILDAEPYLFSVLASRHASALLRCAEAFASRMHEAVVSCANGPSTLLPSSLRLATSVGPVLGRLIDPSISAGATTATARERLPSLADAVSNLLALTSHLSSSTPFETDAAVGANEVLRTLLSSFLPAFAQASQTRREVGIKAVLSSFGYCASLLTNNKQQISFETGKVTGKRKRSYTSERHDDSGVEAPPVDLVSPSQSFIYDTLFIPETLRSVLLSPSKLDGLKLVVQGLSSDTRALLIGPDLLTVLTNRFRALPVELPEKEKTIRTTMLQFLSQLFSAVEFADPDRTLLLAQMVSAASAVGLYRPGPDLDGTGASWSSLLLRVLEGALTRLVHAGGVGRASDLRAAHALWTVDSNLVSTHLGQILLALWMTNEHDAIAAAEPLLVSIFDTARRARGVPQLTIAMMDAAHEALSQGQACTELINSISALTTTRAIILRAEAVQSLPTPLAIGLVQNLSARQDRFSTADNASWAIEAYMTAQILHIAPLAPDAGGFQAWVQTYRVMDKSIVRVQHIRKVKNGTDEIVARAVMAIWASAQAALVRAKSVLPPSSDVQNMYASDLEYLSSVAHSVGEQAAHLHNLFKSASTAVLRAELADTLLWCATSGMAPDPRRLVTSVLEALETPDAELYTTLFQVIIRWASQLNQFSSEVLMPAARWIVKSWGGFSTRSELSADSDTKSLLILRFTAGNALFIELSSWRDAIVTAMLQPSSKPVRDATKLAGARHFLPSYWGKDATIQIQLAARKADNVLISNGSFDAAASIRELLAQTQVGDALFQPAELATLVASAHKVKDLHPSTALFARAWVSNQAVRGTAGQTAIREARGLLSDYPWVLYTFSAAVMRLYGRTQAGDLLRSDQTSFSRVRSALKSFRVETATGKELQDIERAIRDAAVSCYLAGANDSEQTKAFTVSFALVSQVAIERSKAKPERAKPLDGLLLSILELDLAMGRTDELINTYVLAREAVYLSGVHDTTDVQTVILRSAVSKNFPDASAPAPASGSKQAPLVSKVNQEYQSELATYLISGAPGLCSRVAARIDVLVAILIATPPSSTEEVQAYLLRFLTTAAMVQTDQGCAPVINYAFAAGAAALVRAYHQSLEREHVEQLVAFIARVLSPCSASGTSGSPLPTAAENGPKLGSALCVGLIAHLLNALGVIMRQRRKAVRECVPAVSTALTLFFPLLQIKPLDGQACPSGVLGRWGAALDTAGTAHLASSLSYTLESITLKGITRSTGRGKAASASSLADDFAHHAHAILAAYARSLLGARELVRNPLDRTHGGAGGSATGASLGSAGHVPPEVQRMLEPGVFALCDAAALAPAGRDVALRFHLSAPSKAVLKRIWSAWEAQRYKGQ